MAEGLLRKHESVKRTRLMAATVAPAAAIIVFGGIYGSLAEPLMGWRATVLSSLLIFSGAVQFALVALLSAGAGAGAIVAGSAALNLRNLVLGAVLRPHVGGGRWERAGLAWFLVDESAGLAMAAGANAGPVLLGSGVIFYFSWQLGTVLGLVGASVEAISSAAGAVFPVLFIGLAAISCRSRSVAVRAVVAAVVTSVAAVIWPETRAVVAVVAAIAVAMPGGEG